LAGDISLSAKTVAMPTSSLTWKPLTHCRVACIVSGFRIALIPASRLESDPGDWSMRKVGHRWFLPGALPFLSRFVGSCRWELVAQNSGRSFEAKLSLNRNAAVDTTFSKACANGMGITVYSRLSRATCHKKGERQGRGLPTGIGPILRQPRNSETEALSDLRESALSTMFCHGLLARPLLAVLSKRSSSVRGSGS
jgi:hypothetical protein